MGGVGGDDEPPVCVCAQQISPMHNNNNNNTKNTKYQRSQLADRAEREAAERQRLADAVLEDEELQARSNNWASFLQGKKGKRRKRDGGYG